MGLNVTGDTNLSVDTDSFAVVWKSAGEQAETNREKNRKLAPELARDLADAGMFKLFVPAEIGGLENWPPSRAIG